MYKHVSASMYKCVCLLVQTRVKLHEPYTLHLICTVCVCVLCVCTQPEPGIAPEARDWGSLGQEWRQTAESHPKMEVRGEVRKG